MFLKTLSAKKECKHFIFNVVICATVTNFVNWRTHNKKFAQVKEHLGMFSVWTFSMGRVVFFNEAHKPWWTKIRKNVQFLPTVQRKFVQKVLVLNFEVLIIQQLVNIFYCAIIICSSLCFRPQWVTWSIVILPNVRT